VSVHDSRQYRGFTSTSIRPHCLSRNVYVSERQILQLTELVCAAAALELVGSSDVEVSDEEACEREDVNIGFELDCVELERSNGRENDGVNGTTDVVEDAEERVVVPSVEESMSLVDVLTGRLEEAVVLLVACVLERVPAVPDACLRRWIYPYRPVSLLPQRSSG
jgi:hypothetical protein